MRTKALLLTAALGAVGLSTSIAQTVYSVNAVGFVNVAVPKGFSIIANPLNNSNNNITNLFAGADDGTTVYKFDATTGFSINAYDALAGEWGIPNQTLVPGEAAFINAPAAHSFTFIGEVKQSTAGQPLSHPVPKGLSLQASEVPQSGALDTVLGWVPDDGDTIYFFRNATKSYDIFSYDALAGAWDPAAPVPAVAEGFFAKKAAAKPWTRVFSVNQ